MGYGVDLVNQHVGSNPTLGLILIRDPRNGNAEMLCLLGGGELIRQRKLVIPLDWSSVSKNSVFTAGITLNFVRHMGCW